MAGEERLDLGTAQLAAQDGSAAAINTDLAISRPIMLASITDGLLCWMVEHPSLAHRCRRGPSTQHCERSEGTQGGATVLFRRLRLLAMTGLGVVVATMASK
jgi:hypothetical protein